VTHDCEQNGVTTLCAAFNVEDGAVLGRCIPQHWHQEFVRVLNAVEGAVPAGKLIHAIADNYATRKHRRVRLAGAASTVGVSLYPDLGFLDRCRRGLLLSAEPKAPAMGRVPIRRRPQAGHCPPHPRASSPIVWTKPAATILTKFARLPAPSE
jgi:hypothetical protein